MKEQILIRGEQTTGHRAFRCFLPAGSITAMTLLYALILYTKNVNGSHYAFAEESCFPEWEYSFFEFLKLSMGPNSFFVSLTLLIWLSLLCLAAAACLFMAFGDNEITVTNLGIRGKAAFGRQVMISLPAVLDAEEVPGHCLKLSLFSGSLIFGGIRNQKEVCRTIRENLVLREAQNKQRVQIASRGISALKLAVLCALPCLLLFLPILLGGEPSLGKAWEAYRRTERFQQRFSFPAFWLASQMDTGKNWPISLIYAAFPALLAGGVLYYACSRQKITVTDSRARGRAAFRGAFDLPLSELIQVKQGKAGTVVLRHSRGKLWIPGLKNRQEVLQVLEKSPAGGGKAEADPGFRQEEKLESRAVSDLKLGILSFLPLAFFLILFAVGIGMNAGFCREVYGKMESIRAAHSYVEYLLIWVLAENLGRWIKGFFWLSLPGIAVFFANRSQRLTLEGGRIRGRCRSGGCLDTETASVCGASLSRLGSLTLYTDSGKFTFGYLKNGKVFYDFFCEKFAGQSQQETETE